MIGAYRMNRISLIFLFSIVLWLIRTPSAFGQSEHTAKLIEVAKKEKRLVWYTSLAVQESKPFLDAFEKKYPFVKTELLRASLESTINRIRTETQGGRWQFDVVSTAGLNILVQYKLLSPYVSPEAKFYNLEFKDRNGHWTGVLNTYYVLGYNTGMVPEAEAPKDWVDLLDPKWKGKISIDREEYEWYATLLAAWGKEKTEKYMQALAKQDIQWRKGHTLIAQLMAAGEFPVASVYAHRIESMKKNGAPVEWVNTLDPVVVAIHSIALSAKPNNPNAAKLFIDFALSKEGQEVIRSFNRIPVRSDMQLLSSKLDHKKLKLKVVPQDMETRYNEYVQEFRRMFGL